MITKWNEVIRFLTGFESNRQDSIRKGFNFILSYDLTDQVVDTQGGTYLTEGSLFVVVAGLGNFTSNFTRLTWAAIPI